MKASIIASLALAVALTAYCQDASPKANIITVHLKPSTAAGELVYVETTPPAPTLKLGQMGSRDMTMKMDAIKEIQQGDTLR